MSALDCVCLILKFLFNLDVEMKVEKKKGNGSKKETSSFRFHQFNFSQFLHNLGNRNSRQALLCSALSGP